MIFSPDRQVINDAASAFLQLSEWTNEWKDPNQRSDLMYKLKKDEESKIQNMDPVQASKKYKCDKDLALHIKEQQQIVTQDKIEKVEEYLDTETPVKQFKSLFDAKLPIDRIISDITRPLVRNIC